jgi:hypothetical protein
VTSPEPALKNVSSAGWEAALDHAFDVLLDGRGEENSGAADAIARYGVFYEDDAMDEYLFPNTWLTAEALTDGEPRILFADLADEYPFPLWEWGFDLRETLFRFSAHILDGAGAKPGGEGGRQGLLPFDDAFVADVRAVSVGGGGEVAVRGADLAPLLDRHGIDLTSKETGNLNCWLTMLRRVATDGTLGGAVRAATFTWRGPEHLVRPGTEWYPSGLRTDKGWEQALDTVGHPALRDHMRLLCLDAQDARAYGASYCGAERWPTTTGILTESGCSLVAGWEFGEAQAGTVVVRLPDQPSAGLTRLNLG